MGSIPIHPRQIWRWRADPAEDMTTILLTPMPWLSAYPPPVYNDFWTLAYSAIDD